ITRPIPFPHSGPRRIHHAAEPPRPRNPRQTTLPRRRHRDSRRRSLSITVATVHTFRLRLFERRQNTTVFGGFAAHLEVVVRFESDFANSTLGSFFVTVISRHHTYRKRTIFGEHDP